MLVIKKYVGCVGGCKTSSFNKSYPGKRIQTVFSI